jgi:hypothetical protein
MSICPLSRIPRLAPLAACLATALGFSLSAAHAASAPLPKVLSRESTRASAFELPSYLIENTAKQSAATRVHTPIEPAGPPRYVTSCGDDANTPGTLRYEVLNAADGATIDLSTLVCSTITLGSPIAILQNSLYLKGPAAGPASLTIDANNQSEVFNHFGSSTLLISNLTIANGFYINDVFPYGGCVFSEGNVGLFSSVVSHCTIWSTSNSVAAKGGGVYTRGGLTLFQSTITDSIAFAQNGAKELGGGAYAKGGFTALYSTISNNTAIALGGGHGDGGGVYAFGDVYIESSTISGNRADIIGGIDLDGGALHTATVINSTISSNTATLAEGGIWTNVPLTLTSTTVAFNRCLDGCSGGGLFSNAVPLNLQSSIIADNVGLGGPSDLNGANGTVVSGAKNLITSSTLSLSSGIVAVSACPQLEPLTDNGGPTRTHALKHTSPAIDQGSAGNLVLDQRGAARVAGPSADIGSVEWQPGEADERVFADGLDGLCDQ